MAKSKEKWQSEDVALNNNPFAALSGLKKKDPPANAPETDKKADSGNTPAMKLPKIKSTRLEKAQRGGKIVTVVMFHGEPSDEALSLWLKVKKKELGVGGSVEENTVILQGDQRERL